MWLYLVDNKGEMNPTKWDWTKVSINATAGYNTQYGVFAGVGSSGYTTNIAYKNGTFTGGFTASNGITVWCPASSVSPERMADAAIARAKQNAKDAGQWTYRNVLADGALEGHADVANLGFHSNLGIKYMGTDHGIPTFETTYTDENWGAVTPGPFVIYSKGKSSDPYYNAHEHGHAIQALILGPVLYRSLVMIPSFWTATFMSSKDAMEMPYEKSASTLTYWLTGRKDLSNPIYFDNTK